MSTATVSSKGQVVIPKDVRDNLGIAAGSRIEFVVENGSVRLKLSSGKPPSKLADGPKVLAYKGKRVPISSMRVTKYPKP
ncbi:MAG: AbrB/MazE/SpoVT family DNA-binding domain-containing protein [Burkholderiaceae bacterium]